jgi:hypothetical protein
MDGWMVTLDVTVYQTDMSAAKFSTGYLCLQLRSEEHAFFNYCSPTYMAGLG